MNLNKLSRTLYRANQLASFAAAAQRGPKALARRTGRYAVRREVWKTLPWPFGGRR